MANMLVNKYAKAKTGLDFARNVFTFKKGHKTNFLTGRIVPSIDPIEVLPGDSFNLSFAAVVRSAPLVAPVLDDLFIDVVAMWVPNRLVMNEFAQYLGENNAKAWTLKQDVDLPSISRVNWPVLTIGSIKASSGYLADHYLAPHFGFRLVSEGYFDATDAEVGFFSNGVLTLKSRGYDLIYNEWWRDENIIDPVLFSKESGIDNSLDGDLYSTALGVQRKACRLSDFWNKMLPAPQRGDAVGIDLLGFAPVYTRSVLSDTRTEADTPNLFWKNKTGDSFPDYSGFLGVGSADLEGGPGTVAFNEDTNNDNIGLGSIASDGFVVPSNLWADLSNVSALTINQLRYAIMLQRFYEISARGGMREVEFYQAQFGVTSSDARFMRSELLTQKRYRINISQVINQAGSSDGETETSINSALGSTGAYSVTGIKGHLFSKTFTEYGYIHIQHVIRTQPSISTGFDRSNFKVKFFDHFLPVFDHIGEQAYYDIELGKQDAETISVFGYNEAWAEYRYQYSDAVGLFTPGEPLEYWTLSRFFEAPVLNQTFIEQGIEEFDRALIFPMIGTGSGRDGEGVLIQSNTYQWLIDFYVTGKMARTMSKDSTPGILGRI